MAELVAIGYTSTGVKKPFIVYQDSIFCQTEDLVSLTIPEGVKYVYCQDNLLTSIIVPNSISVLTCYNNKLVNITFNKDCSPTQINARQNLLTYLNIPNSLTKNLRMVRLDRKVKGLDNLIDMNNIHVILR